MRPSIPTASLLAALALGACGSDASDAESTVSTAVAALARGDAETACERLTPAAERSMLVRLRDNPLLPSITARTCEEGVTKLHAKLSKTVLAVLEDGEVGEAKVDGDNATVPVVGAGVKVRLRKQDDTWYIVGGFFD